MSGIRFLALAVAVTFASIHSGCVGEQPTQVTISGGASPIFTLLGNGDLATFTVYLVPPDSEHMAQPISTTPPVWRIVAKPDFLHGRPISQMRHLMYGVVPKGYQQTSDPQAIVPGTTYYFNCETTNAPSAWGFFRVENGKAMPTEAKLPCLDMRNGKWITVPCAQNN